MHGFEIVINSNPCISYNIDDNTMTMQTIVMAHAAFGHNHFFKNNYLFKEWTDADGILDYLNFAKAYVSRCEEQHGIAAVERVIDAAHALMDNSVNRYGRRPRPSFAAEKKRAEERLEHQRTTVPLGRKPAKRATVLAPKLEQRLPYPIDTNDWRLLRAQLEQPLRRHPGGATAVPGSAVRSLS